MHGLRLKNTRLPILQRSRCREMVGITSLCYVFLCSLVCMGSGLHDPCDDELLIPLPRQSQHEKRRMSGWRRRRCCVRRTRLVLRALINPGARRSCSPTHSDRCSIPPPSSNLLSVSFPNLIWSQVTHITSTLLPNPPCCPLAPTDEPHHRTLSRKSRDWGLSTNPPTYLYTPRFSAPEADNGMNLTRSISNT